MRFSVVGHSISNVVIDASKEFEAADEKEEDGVLVEKDDERIAVDLLQKEAERVEKKVNKVRTNESSCNFVFCQEKFGIMLTPIGSWIQSHQRRCRICRQFL